MRVGIPTEIKVQEFRVGITPAGVHALKEAGHTVLVQKGAGLGSMITDEEYVAAGAQMVATAKECWDCDMVVKVKEPLAPEYDLFHEGLILYTYLHLAPEPAPTLTLTDRQAELLMQSRYAMDDDRNTQRMRRQQIFLNAFMKKIKKQNAGDVNATVKLYDRLRPYATKRIFRRIFLTYVESAR